MEYAFLKKKKIRISLYICLGLVFFIFSLWLLNHYVLDRPSFCTSCHLIQSAYDSWLKAKHKPEYTNNSCNVCHVEPGLLGSIKASFYGLENTYTFFFGVDEDDIKASKPVYCTQKGCHEQMEKSMVVKKIRVNHAMHMEMGYSCIICHDRVAHEDYAMVKDISMMETFCFPCHNDEIAPRNDCDICHVYQDQILKGINVLADSPMITSPHYQDEMSCQDCHVTFTDPAENNCLNCHQEEILQQYKNKKPIFTKQLKSIKQQIDESRDLFSKTKGSGLRWDKYIFLFEEVQKNYNLLIQDSSMGAHNQKLTEKMITQSEKNIQTVRYFLYNYQR